MKRKALHRTMTGLASVVPIGVLMILHLSKTIPSALVTPVCHAAILAIIQRYVPRLVMF
ncbi:unnamed protein product, partial [Brassica oleracea var. botrytis]